MRRCSPFIIDVLIATAHVTSHSHAETSRDSRARVARAVAIMFALGAEKESIEPFVLTHRVNTIQPPGQQLVRVRLMTGIPDDLVARRFK